MQRAGWHRVAPLAAAVAGVVAALVLAGGRAGGGRSPEGYLSLRGDGFLLHAPSPGALAEGAAELAAARASFHGYFGWRAPELVVLLADDPAALAATDWRRARRADAAFLPFLTRRHADGDSTAGVAFTRTRALAHEACHRFVAERAGGAAGAEATSYGSAALPDAVDEMAATLCESPASRTARLAHLRARPDDWIPLSTLLRMPHPVDARRLASAAAAPDGPVQVVDGAALEAVLDGTRAESFYAQSLALGLFLHARGGPGALRAFVEATAEGAELDAALARAHAVSPGVPSAPAEMEAAWRRWIADGQDLRAATHP